MGPSNPVRAPVLYPGAKRAGMAGRISSSRTRILVLRARGSASSHASEQGTKGCVHQKPAQATQEHAIQHLGESQAVAKAARRPAPPSLLSTDTSVPSPLCLQSRCLGRVWGFGLCHGQGRLFCSSRGQQKLPRHPKSSHRLDCQEASAVKRKPEEWGELKTPGRPPGRLFPP